MSGRVGPPPCDVVDDVRSLINCSPNDSEPRVSASTSSLPRHPAPKWLDGVLPARDVLRAVLALALPAVIPELRLADPRRGRLVEEGFAHLARARSESPLLSLLCAAPRDSPPYVAGGRAIPHA
jgi:hypothetical protein